MSRRIVRLTGVLTFFIFVAVACGDASQVDTAATEAAAEEPKIAVDLSLTWVYKGEWAPIYMALLNGYFDDEGLDVKIGQGVGTSTTVQLVGLGTEDMGYGTSSTVAAGIANEGFPVTIAAVYEQTVPIAIVSHPENPINTPQDLEGKTIAVGPGAGQVQLEAFCEVNDVDCSAIDIVNMDRSARSAAFFNKQVDGVDAFFNNELAIWEFDQNTEFVVMKFGAFNFPLPGAGLFINNEWLAENEEAIPGLLRAIERGFEFVRDNPEETADLYIENFWKGDAPDREVVVRQIREVVASVFSKAPEDGPLGSVPDGYWNDALDLMLNAGMISELPPVETVFTDTYLLQVGGD